MASTWPLLATGGWEQVRPEVEVKLVPTPQGEETYVLCRSTTRREKELAIRNRFSTCLEKGLKALAKRVAEGKLKDRSKVERRLGSLPALRTNLPTTDPEQLWKSYIQLTEAEAAFCALKSELSTRPIFHQLERRAKAHTLVAFLGYALWVTLQRLLMRKRSDLFPAKALHLLSIL